MDITPELQTLLMNITTVAGEVVFVVLAFVIINFVFARLFSALAAAQALSGISGVVSMAKKNLRAVLVLIVVLSVMAKIGVNASSIN